MGNSRSKAGFTLIEIVISMVVMAFVLISVAGIFVLFQKGVGRAGEYAQAQQNARVALDVITDDIRQAGSQTDYYRTRVNPCYR
jgi:type IV pilus assembly protein PilW